MKMTHLQIGKALLALTILTVTLLFGEVYQIRRSLPEALSSYNLDRYTDTPCAPVSEIEPFTANRFAELESTQTDGLKVALLLSFPNSGTSFTLDLVRDASSRSFATSYIDENKSPGKRLFNGTGPFVLYEDENRRLPDHYILTKTHCAGYCVDCYPHNYMTLQEDFPTSCRTVWSSPGNASTYDVRFVGRAIHLFRDPLDNVVSRFHHQRKRYINENKTSWVAAHPNTGEGIIKFCAAIDEQTFPSEEVLSVFFGPKVMGQNFSMVPCRTDLLRYVRWHHNALAMLESANVPVLTLHYEDYETDLDNSLSQIMRFLELYAVNRPPPFLAGKTYRHLFTHEERTAMLWFVDLLANSALKRQLSRYLNK